VKQLSECDEIQHEGIVTHGYFDTVFVVLPFSICKDTTMWTEIGGYKQA
jgi:hypothetical protein